MGKVIEDLDIQINSIRLAYLNAIQRREYDLAIHFLEMMHNALPLNARISNFEKWKEPKNITFTYPLRSIMSDYCLKWSPLIESAISVHRDKLLRELNS